MRRYALKGISVSIAAWLGSWPVVAYYFNIVSPIALIANLIVIPLLFVLTAASPLLFILPVPSAAAIEWLTQAVFSVNHILSGVPLAYMRIPAPSAPFLILYYCLIGLAIVPNRRGLIAILLGFNLLLWKDIVSMDRDRPQAVFFDVGSGDAAVIKLPGGVNIMVDGGPGGEYRLDTGKAVIAPYLWNHMIRKLDIVIITHFHDDHLGGIPYLLNNFKIGCVIDNGARVKDSALYGKYKQIIKKKNIRHVTAGEGDEVKLSGDARIFILNPPKDMPPGDSNESSIAFKITCDDFSALFCGDINSGAMKRIINYDTFLKADILKVPHHGTGLGEEEIVKIFFQKASPKSFIISAGADNYRSSPSENIIGIISSFNSKKYVTGETGAVEIGGNEDN